MSRMGGNLFYSYKQLDFEPGLYRIKTISTWFHPHSTCQFLRILGATIRRRKHFGHVQNFCAFQTIQKSILNPFQPLSTSTDPDVRPCHNPLHEGQCSIWQGSMRFYIAGWCGSMRLEPGQYGYQYRIKIHAKILNMIKTFFSAISYPQNPSGIDKGYDAGLYRWNRIDMVLIPYGPGLKSGCVWLHFWNADLIVNCFDLFWPVWTCI
jgi:hypothetical protein